MNIPTLLAFEGGQMKKRIVGALSKPKLRRGARRLARLRRARRCPSITVRLWAGRTREQKAELARRITDAMVEVAGCERATVRVIFEDYAKADWAVGGRLADEAD